MTTQPTSIFAAHPNLEKGFNLTKDVLSFVVIPIVLWAVSVHTGDALQDERIQALQAEIVKLREQQKELELVKKDIQDAAVHMARLEGKLDVANGRLDEIRSIVR